MNIRAALIAASLSGSLLACADAADHASTPVAETPPAATSTFGYEFDTVHTQVLFFVDHIGFSKSQGEFLEFDGGFNFVEGDWSQSSVEVDIDTNSITMNNGKWDAHMKNADFFDVEKFPTMTFSSTKVEPIDGKTGKVHGNLTILGVTKPVVLNATFNKAGIHPFSKRFVAGFSATTSVKRSDFGMTYGIPAIGDNIEIRLEVEGMKPKQ